MPHDITSVEPQNDQEAERRREGELEASAFIKFSAGKARKGKINSFRLANLNHSREI